MGAEGLAGALRRPARVAAPGLAAALLLAASAPARAVIPTGFTDQTILQGINQPVAMAFLPDGRLLFTEQFTGRVRLLVQGKLGQPDPILTVSELDNGSEQGLLGIAADPGWPARPYLYVHYDHQPTSRIIIARFTVSGEVADPLADSLACDPASEYRILTDIPDLAFNHNGGTVRFGKDGMLYVSLGEDATSCAAQDTSTLRGVILRLDVSGLPPGPGGPPSKSLITPAGNPFTGVAPPGSSENARLVWALGLRNPFRFHVDPLTGHLFIADVGQNTFEEVDWDTTGGMNFGWPYREGPGSFLAFCSGIVRPPVLAEPIAWYDRSGFGASVISGGIYRAPADTCGAPFPAEYEGDYFYAEYYQGFVRRIERSGSTWVPAAPVPGQPNANDWANGLVSVADFALGPEGGLWYLRQFNSSFQPNTGSIHRLLGPDIRPRRPAVAGGGWVVIGLRDTVPLRFTVRNRASCPRAHVYRLRDPQGLVVAGGTPLDGVTPALAPGDSFELSVRVTTPLVCDSLLPDSLFFSSHPLDFPDSLAADTTRVRCNPTPTLGVTSFTLEPQGLAVRLEWTARDPGITGFNVYRSGPGGPEWVFERLNHAPLPFTGASSYRYLDDTVEPGRFYAYQVSALIGGAEYPSVPLSLTLPPAGALELGAPHPNPSEGSTTLVFYLGSDSRVDVTVRDLSGRSIRQLLSGAPLASGRQVAVWDGRDHRGRRAPAGLYFMEVKAAGASDSRRVVLAR